MLKRTFMILLSVIAVLVLFCNQEAGAVANGDGFCQPTELANKECASFGSNVIEYLGAVDMLCYNASSGLSDLPCTRYNYKYTGVATNQIIAAVPANVEVFVNVASENDCNQWIPNGTGDPTTGFGVGFKTFGLCRIPPNSISFHFNADRSFIDKNEPLNWQVRISSKEVYWGSIVGPVALTAPVEQSGATLTTSEGKSVSYAIQGGEVIITGGIATLVPIENTKLCLPTLSGQDITFTTSTGVNYTCETISFVDEKCTIKTTGSDPCTYIGNVCMRW